MQPLLKQFSTIIAGAIGSRNTYYIIYQNPTK